MLYSLSPHKSLFFGLFPIPDLFSMPQVADVAGWREVLEGLHGFFGAAFAALIVLHVGAALKHHFVLRDAVLLRMAPAFLAPVLRLLRGER
jgi:cytochrome b561